MDSTTQGVDPSIYTDLWSDSKASPSSNRMMCYAQTISMFYPRANFFYRWYLLNVHPHRTKYIDVESLGLVYSFLPYADGSRWQIFESLKTGEELQTVQSESKTETTGFPSNEGQTFCFPYFLANSPPSQDAAEDISKKIVDKNERRKNFWNYNEAGDELWEFNQRRPSVIRRLIPNDDSCSPREAVLTPNVSPQPFIEKEEGIKTNESWQSSPIHSESHHSHPCSNSRLDPSKANDFDVQTKCTLPSPFNDMMTELNVMQSKISAEEVGSSTTEKNCKFLCFFCKKLFQRFSHWQAHQQAHVGKIPFKHQPRRRGFSKADGLQCHVASPLKYKSFKCPLCSKTFQKKAFLEKHVFAHTSIKPFKCEYCNKQFSDAESIQTHLLIHKEDKSFRCQYCNHSFINAKRLVRHIRGHEGK